VGGGGSGCLADPSATPAPGRAGALLGAAALTSSAGVIKCFSSGSSNRVYSIAFHPNAQKLVAMAGGRFGQLSLWAPGEEACGRGGGGSGGGNASAAAPSAGAKRARSGGDGGSEGEEEQEGEGGGSGGGGGDDAALRELAVFDMHSEVIAAIAVPSAAPHNIFTASLDCTIRCLDAVAGISYDIHEDEGKPAALCFEHGSSDGWAGGHTFWVGNREGQLYHLDTRLRRRGAGRGPGGTSGVCQAHVEGKKITTVCLNPSGVGTVLTASGDGTVKLWDARRLPRHGARGKATPEPLHTLEHGSTVCSAYFSPWGGHIASACNDDLIRVWDTTAVMSGSAAPKYAVKHDMHTGASSHPQQHAP
jgi:WD40 repeat protein